ncbi:hypothetical protein K435DRAFT_838278 [Dendrothele bispora CBS 962.96]|uniref:Uncharacterized protein n=1 Tax=Dendrothele bispora (strain CBS 962.96) TaxID=1314807 RepID=A0A4S8M760_DENBC|nr:hypothetical protein K435DRAFT_838278 [Dendrothele bispora CBS 962.96]
MTSMTVENEMSGILNPSTPLAFLPPALAHDAQGATLIQVAALGMSVWDMLTHLKSDYKMFKKYPSQLSTWIYFLSRIERPLGFLSLKGIPIAQTKSCVFLTGIQLNKILILTGVVSRLMYDTLVFVAVAHVMAGVAKLGTRPPPVDGKPNEPSGVKKIFLYFSMCFRRKAISKQFSRWSRGIFKNERRLYLTSMISSLCSIFVVADPNIGEYYRISSVTLSVALMNSVACYGFGKMRMENRVISDSITSSFISRELAFLTGPGSVVDSTDGQQDPIPRNSSALQLSPVSSETPMFTKTLPPRLQNIRMVGITRRSASAIC